MKRPAIAFFVYVGGVLPEGGGGVEEEDPPPPQPTSARAIQYVRRNSKAAGRARLVIFIKWQSLIGYLQL